MSSIFTLSITRNYEYLANFRVQPLHFDHSQPQLFLNGFQIHPISRCHNLHYFLIYHRSLPTQVSSFVQDPRNSS